jgi:serine protease Do
MVDKSALKIVIRHKTGSKANQIEEFVLGDRSDYTIGRDLKCDIAFDQTRDDLVSRRHAVIRISKGDDYSFFISDNNSSNGTFLNGQKISDERELLPEDLVQLGEKGPSFLFDLSPRPASMSTRTRVISGIDSAATRVVSLAEAAKATKSTDTSKALPDSAGPVKTGVGKDTVQLMLSTERKSTNRFWIAALGGVLVFVAAAGGALYWRQKIEADELRLSQARSIDRLRNENSAAQSQAASALTAQLGQAAQDIARNFGNATARIDFKWRVFDSITGRPVFHKVVTCNRVRSLAFVRLKDGTVHRWLTLEDQEGDNVSIGSAGSGSGFVVSENGFLLTNKHVAASWNTDFEKFNYIEAGLVWDWDGQRPRSDACGNAKKIALNDGSAASRDFLNWKPTSGMLFETLQAVPLSATKRTFLGRNETLTVTFPGSKLPITANPVRDSTDADVSLIKIDAVGSLQKVEIAADDNIVVGEKAFTIGYPGVSQSTRVVNLTNERGQTDVTVATIPEPTITEGIVSNVAPKQVLTGDTRVVSSFGDTFQLAINTTGAGNSGGPVFNASGKVIGIYTYGSSSGGATVSFAVPIKYGRDLLRAQR